MLDGATNAAVSDLGTAAPRKRGRPRNGEPAFDHDVARAMRADGQSYYAIARELGVHPSSVRNACAKASTRYTPRLPLAGSRCHVTDERWRDLEAWIDRRHGLAGTYSRATVQIRRWTPKATA